MQGAVQVLRQRRTRNEKAAHRRWLARTFACEACSLAVWLADVYDILSHFNVCLPVARVFHRQNVHAGAYIHAAIDRIDLSLSLSLSPSLSMTYRRPCMLH